MPDNAGTNMIKTHSLVFRSSQSKCRDGHVEKKKRNVSDVMISDIIDIIYKVLQGYK